MGDSADLTSRQPTSPLRPQEHVTHLVWRRGLCCHRGLPGTSPPPSGISGTEKKGGLGLSEWVVVGQLPATFQFTTVISKAGNVCFP